MSEFEDLYINPQSPQFMRPAPFTATRSSLWTRQATGKSSVLRVSTMVPQVKLTSEVQQALWRLSQGLDSRSSKTAYLAGKKYSANHFLSVKVTECVMRKPTDHDFTAKTFPRQLNSPDRLTVKTWELEELWNDVLDKIDAYDDDRPLEPLDVVTAALVCCADNQQLKFKCDLIYPTASFNFTPISPLKIVSSPLSLKLAKKSVKVGKFQTGFLTLDLNQRLLPLLLSDPMVQKYPLVGIWVTNIPRSSQPSPSSLMHPLVWSACVRFIQTRSVKEKISPDPELYSFLCVHFSTKPKFFEVSSTDEISWQVASVSSQVSRQEEGYFAPTFVSFLKEDQPDLTLASCTSDATMNFTYTLPPTSERVLTSSRRPPRFQRCSSARTSSDSKGSSSKENTTTKYSDCRPAVSITEEFMLEQARLVKMLEHQVRELQSHLLTRSETPCLTRSYSRDAGVSMTQPELKRTSTCTNTSICHKKELVSTATNTSCLADPRNISVAEAPVYNLARYSSTEKDLSLYSEAKPVGRRPYRAFSMQDTSVSSSASDYLGFEAEVSHTYKPNEFYYGRRESADQTITMPKIICEPVYESSDEDEGLQMVQMKYLR